jgi:iron-sulfur cluster repair protein YtfE (RIC family)
VKKRKLWRKPPEEINAQISQFKATYHTQDDLNLAIMACLKFATDLVRISQQSEQGKQEVKKALDTLEEQLSMHLE